MMQITSFMSGITSLLKLMNEATHLQTLEADIRKILNSCDLKEANLEFFLTATIVGDLARFVQGKEADAYKRGVASITPPLK